MTNNAAWLSGSALVDAPITTGNWGTVTSASLRGTTNFRSVPTGRSFPFTQSLYCVQLPCTLVPLYAMKRAGLRSALDESALVFRFYRHYELQFEAAVDNTGF